MRKQLILWLNGMQIIASSFAQLICAEYNVLYLPTFLFIAGGELKHGTYGQLKADELIELGKIAFSKK